MANHFTGLHCFFIFYTRCYCCYTRCYDSSRATKGPRLLPFQISKTFSDFKIIFEFQNHFRISKSFSDFKIIFGFQNLFRISKSFSDFKIIFGFQNHFWISKSFSDFKIIFGFQNHFRISMAAFAFKNQNFSWTIRKKSVNLIEKALRGIPPPPQ